MHALQGPLSVLHSNVEPASVEVNLNVNPLGVLLLQFALRTLGDPGVGRSLIALRRYGHIDGRCIGPAVAIADRVGEFVISGESGVGGVGADPSRCATGVAIIAVGLVGDREAVAVGIAVVGQHVDITGCVLGRREAVVDRVGVLGRSLLAESSSSW